MHLGSNNGSVKCCYPSVSATNIWIIGGCNQRLYDLSAMLSECTHSNAMIDFTHTLQPIGKSLLFCSRQRITTNCITPEKKINKFYKQRNGNMNDENISIRTSKANSGLVALPNVYFLSLSRYGSYLCVYAHAPHLNNNKCITTISSSSYYRHIHSHAHILHSLSLIHAQTWAGMRFMPTLRQNTVADAIVVSAIYLYTFLFSLFFLFYFFVLCCTLLHCIVHANIECDRTDEKLGCVWHGWCT